VVALKKAPFKDEPFEVTVELHNLQATIAAEVRPTHSSV
jgi:hypothetical protein